MHANKVVRAFHEPRSVAAAVKRRQLSMYANQPPRHRRGYHSWSQCARNSVSGLSMKRLIVLVLGVVLDPITDFEDEDEQEDDPVR
jgi:hypothetical protein